MAMTVKNNKLATVSLGELNKNIVEKGKRMTRLATGQKIVGASDGASEFSITEKMQVQLRSLGQDVENTKTGRSMLSVGAGGIERIVEELRGMKQLAINAANDTNTDADRATIQKEFDQKKQDIADIVATTHYNGKLLLDGTYSLYRNASLRNHDGFISPYGPRGATPAPVTSFGPTTTESWPSDGVIRYGGAYTIPDGYVGTVTIDGTAAAGGVRLSQAGEILENVNINVEAPSSGGANLWLDGVHIENSDDASIIQFAGSDNTLTLLGDSTLVLFPVGSATAAVVDMGDGLTVQGNGSSLTIIAQGSNGAGIGTDAGGTTNGELKVIDANLTLHMGSGAAIGSGGSRASVGNITIENTTIDVTGGVFAAIGAGYDHSSCGDILFSHSTINDVYVPGFEYLESDNLGSVDTCIGSGYANSSCGNIEVRDSIVNARNSDSALVGAGDNGSTCQDITISNSDVIGFSYYGAGVGSGRAGSRANNIEIKNYTRIQHESSDGAAVGSGLNSHVGTISISPSSLRLLDASGAFQDTGTEVPGVGHGRGGTAGDFVGLSLAEDEEPEENILLLGTPLIIHTGTKANQHMRCYIEDLGLEALGIADAELTTQAKAAKLLGNPNKPEEEGVLDRAINYALDEATQVGAYMSRLEQTRDNLITNQENTTSAESTIRDADMAKEMTGFVKSNILTQASQAMLAQANQTSSGVLDLLR